MIAPFAIGSLPRIVFGHGSRAQLPHLITEFGRHALLITGAGSITATPRWSTVITALASAGIRTDTVIITREPSPDDVDRAVQRFRGTGIAVVVAVGGGSVVDAGKAIAGLLPFGNSVFDHLEGVGRGRPYTGPALPFIAMPTTAGTGSEATKNAVLSVVGHDGYKKSFRHDTLVPRYAVVDPDWLDTCPPALIAANGMDALTQLLESFVSTRANSFTDALAESGLRAVAAGLMTTWQGGDHAAAPAARSQMAYGALLSGITLAQAGLGAVHGLASPLGAFFPISHGVACGSTLVAATRINLAALRARASTHPSLEKYARAGRIILNQPSLDADRATTLLLQQLTDWHTQLGLPKLRDFGVRRDDFARIVANSRGNSMQTNPIVLSDAEITAILMESC